MDACVHVSSLKARKVLIMIWEAATTSGMVMEQASLGGRWRLPRQPATSNSSKCTLTQADYARTHRNPLSKRLKD